MTNFSDGELVKAPVHSVWPFRLAVSLLVVVFPLIWVGGLVTTYGAGMAVPDWPGTYGWNMFLYPPSTWLFGGFDLLVEHGHRLLGSLAGLLAIGLCIAAWRNDPRIWFRWWCVAGLLAVVAQGVLGGLRVILDERSVAMIHGCFAQLFLAMATATAVMSSRWWARCGGSADRGGIAEQAAPHGQPASRLLTLLLTLLLIVAYGQVIAGAQLRHVSITARPETFMGLVHIHLFLAFIVFVLSGMAAISAARARHLLGGVKTPALSILLVVLAQVGLGFGTWLVNYALPWQEATGELARFIITSKGYWESVVTTAHLATGALLISLATLACLRAWRSRWRWLGPAGDLAKRPLEVGGNLSMRVT